MSHEPHPVVTDELAARIAHDLMWHRHSRRHHRIECQCDSCKTNGREPCSEDKPCSDCRNNS